MGESSGPGRRPTPAQARTLLARIRELEAGLDATDRAYRDAVERGDWLTAGHHGEAFEIRLHEYERLVDRMSGSPLWPDTVAALAAQVRRDGGGMTQGNDPGRAMCPIEGQTAWPRT